MLAVYYLLLPTHTLTYTHAKNVCAQTHTHRQTRFTVARRLFDLYCPARVELYTQTYTHKQRLSYSQTGMHQHVYLTLVIAPFLLMNLCVKNRSTNKMANSTARRLWAWPNAMIRDLFSPSSPHQACIFPFELHYFSDRYKILWHAMNLKTNKNKDHVNAFVELAT